MTPSTPLAIPRDAVGVTVAPIAHAIDARWLMAYAAGLGETDARYYDTLAPGGPAAHPLFPVCYEWPSILALRDGAVPDAVAIRGVHASHDVTLHRPPRAGDTLRTSARVAALAHRRAGTLMTVRQETVDAEGHPVSTTDYGSVYRGVGFAGEDAGEPARADVGPAVPDGAARLPIAVPVWLAHVYTECARIWNPIHTDIAVARAAGLPDIILHGTATLALAVSRILGHLGADPRSVRRIRGRFTGMVRLPSQALVRVAEARGGSRFVFDVLGADGAPILSRGALEL
jgi:acyl dehydratase